MTQSYVVKIMTESSCTEIIYTAYVKKVCIGFALSARSSFKQASLRLLRRIND